MTRRITILRAGPRTLIQDLGREGYARFGVPPSGALDRPALTAANRRVGNPGHAAGLEVVLGGLRMRTETPCVIAVTGAGVPVFLDGAAVDWCFTCAAGQEVRLGTARSGLRAYVAVSGGLLGEPVLGSLSTDTLTGLGPPPVADGDELALGPAGTPRELDRPPSVPRDVVIPVLPGPREDWFPDAAARLDGRVWTVDRDSDRVGLRLAGHRLDRRSGELPSEGIVTGAVQVPADGRPLIFLNDHPTTGGYPVLGVVVDRALPVLAQLRPGARLRLSLVQAR